MKLIDKDAVVAEIERLYKEHSSKEYIDEGGVVLCQLEDFLDTLEVKEVDLEKESELIANGIMIGVQANKYHTCVYNTTRCDFNHSHLMLASRKGIEFGLKAQKGEIWQVVDNVNHPQADKNKIYCVFTKDRYILATVMNHPKDEELLQWKCTEFPHHRYDMCEGDKYMQII